MISLKMPAYPDEHLLCQSPRSSIRDYGVGEVRNCSHDFDFVLGRRRFEPDAAFLGECDFP